eukprot:gnl/MRDRNA2_/MRDRNA2_135953_c0_seq1.p1 gnl/MRDRNA2_/MRDRNA2_135953_c0~~gnl/MRDRNA2_/MRDRNA2_135953_c0_seq1.p1  ORF type:complete len:423 (-),score=48.88 gnl/MRDRNA2_/MRDRNA2_135953_c0_seq1:51-1319(-)
MKDDPGSTLVQRRWNGLFETRLAMVKGICGSGMLCLAHAMVQGGTGLSCLLLVIACALNQFGAWRLVSCKHALGGTYGSLAFELYGHVGSVAVQCSVMMMQCSFALTYCIFAATTVQRLLVTYEIAALPLSLLMAIQLMLQVPLSWVRRIEDLTVAAFLGNFSMLLGILAICSHCVWMLYKDGPHPGPLVAAEKWPLMAGTSIFAFEGICLLLPLHDALRSEHKPQFLRLWNVTLMQICCFFVFFGVLTQFAFGPNVRPLLPLSMPEGKLATFVQLSFVISQMCTFSLALFPTHQILANALGIPSAEQSLSYKDGIIKDAGGTALRATVVVMLVVAAFFLSEKVDVVAAAAGSLCGIPLTSIYPSLLYLRLEKEASIASKAVDIFVVCASFFCMLLVVMHCMRPDGNQSHQATAFLQALGSM